ncbi:hypothetical protein DEO72_LG8g1856 [Vigna unguiculata]|uniref:Uncharacterized protein n=1 Tax=Vigna unguiculata TaxID=3917 RepID=A0A4D6MV95_VIGUN|nr:hypothetical protein DEO72_LG8g1856 [Vigna unguiculata]
MGHHHELPLTGVMELRPDQLRHHPEISPRDSRNYVLTIYNSCFTNQLDRIFQANGGAPKVREELHGQQKLDEGMEASWKALASNGKGPSETHEFSLKRATPRLNETTHHPKVRFLAWATTAATCLKLPRVLAEVSLSRLSEMIPRSKRGLSA